MTNKRNIIGTIKTSDRCSLDRYIDLIRSIFHALSLYLSLSSQYRSNCHFHIAGSRRHPSPTGEETCRGSREDAEGGGGADAGAGTVSGWFPGKWRCDLWSFHQTNLWSLQTQLASFSSSTLCYARNFFVLWCIVEVQLFIDLSCKSIFVWLLTGINGIAEAYMTTHCVTQQRFLRCSRK